MKNKKMIGNFLLILTAFIWGIAFVGQRMGMERIEPVTFTAVRMALAAAAIGVVSLFFQKKEKEQLSQRTGGEQKAYRKNTVLGGICCGIFLALASIFQQAGIVYTTAGKAGFLTAMYILLVPVISFFLFQKKNSPLVWAAVLLGVAGMYFLCIKQGFTLTKGDALVCVSAVLFSGHILCCGHFAKLGSPIRISVVQFLTTAAVSAVFAVVLEQPSAEKIFSAAIPILYCGIVSGGIGYTLQMVGQQFTDPVIASLLMSLESVFAVLAGAVFLQERMSLREILGCIIMFLAILLVQVPVPEKKTVSR